MKRAEAERLVRSESAAERSAAATALASHGHPDSLESLLPLLEDKNAGVRIAARTAFLACVTAEHLAIVEGLATAGENLTRSMAVEALIQLGDTGADVAEPLFARLSDDTPKVRRAARKALPGLVRPSHLPLVERHLRGQGESTRLLATEVLVSLGRSGVDVFAPLLSQLEDPTEKVHATASEGLRQLLGPPQVPMLRELLGSPDARTRATTIDLLGLLGGEAAFRSLLEHLGFGDAADRARIAAAVGQIDHPEVLGLLHGLFDDADREVRRSAATAWLSKARGLTLEDLADRDALDLSLLDESRKLLDRQQPEAALDRGLELLFLEVLEEPRATANLRHLLSQHAELSLGDAIDRVMQCPPFDPSRQTAELETRAPSVHAVLARLAVTRRDTAETRLLLDWAGHSPGTLRDAALESLSTAHAAETQRSILAIADERSDDRLRLAGLTAIASHPHQDLLESLADILGLTDESTTYAALAALTALDVAPMTASGKVALLAACERASSEMAWRLLLRLCHDPEPSIRTAAHRVLPRPRRPVPPVIFRDLLTLPDPASRLCAIEGLARAKAPFTFPDDLELLNDPDPQVVSAALRWLGPKGASKVPEQQVLSIFQSGNPSLLCTAIETFVPNVAHLEAAHVGSLLHGEDRELRIAAARCVAHLKAWDDHAQFLRFTIDRDPDVAEAARASFTKLGMKFVERRPDGLLTFECRCGYCGGRGFVGNMSSSGACDCYAGHHTITAPVPCPECKGKIREYRGTHRGACTAGWVSIADCERCNGRGGWSLSAPVFCDRCQAVPMGFPSRP